MNILRDVFEDQGWKVPEILKIMDTAPDFYFDTVSQIVMREWANERVTLAGDACGCVSLVAGQGSALAMAGAYTLAGQLKNADGDYKTAFKKYEDIMKPVITAKQKMAEKFADSFVPDTKFGIWKRDTFSKFMFLPFVGKYFVDKFMNDNLEIREY
jgi:2-polyprenyl-6-methoxyphenol hydroxylase-like FAD-dependent oxidoreductase